MTVRDTSAAALAENAPRLAGLCQQITEHMAEHGRICTRHEIAVALGLATATVSGRVNELLKKGVLVEEPGRYICEVTGNMVRGVSYAG